MASEALRVTSIIFYTDLFYAGFLSIGCTLGSGLEMKLINTWP